MKAVVIHQHGSTDVLKYEDVVQPTIRRNQLLVRVRATSVNPLDWKLRKGMLKLLTSFRLPFILGSDVAGDVVAIGDTVTEFKVGDAVYACLDLAAGAYAEYVAVPANYAALKPKNLSYVEAAAVPLAATTALQALRDRSKLQPGQRVLINGAAGGVGTFAVQIAKVLGAEVTAVCSGKNEELVRSLGADRVIDYTQQDVTQLSDTTYDVVFDAVGKLSLARCRNILGSKGVYVTTLPMPLEAVRGLLLELNPGPKSRFVLAQPNGRDLAYLKDSIEAGRVRPIVERTYPLADVAAAHTDSEAGHTVGKIVMTVSS
jgi:NADPH:quinone reductase-like Zn-dependent oxidoreductase